MSRIGTLVRHPRNGDLYRSDDLWNDPTYALLLGRKGFYYVTPEDESYWINRFGIASLSPGEYAEVR